MRHEAGPGPYRDRLRADGQFYLELTYCNDHGIPHSVFQGWEQSDREKAIAFILEKNSKCQMCGTAEWEWDPKQGGKRFAYEAVPKICMGCYVKDAANDDTQRTPGLTIELHPSGTQESAQRLESAKARQKSGRAARSERAARRKER